MIACDEDLPDTHVRILRGSLKSLLAICPSLVRFPAFYDILLKVCRSVTELDGMCNSRDSFKNKVFEY